jgi:predicted naringenin-chalcone synthase
MNTTETNSRIGAVAVASPPYSMDQNEIEAKIVKYYASRLSPRSLGVLRKVFSHPSVLRRRFAFDEPENLVDENPDHRIERFTRWGIDLSEKAIRNALDQAGLGVDEVCGLVVNTCTGYICPGLSTYLVERLGFRRNIFSFDLVGSGCGGAIPNLHLSQALLKGTPEGAIVAVSVEICTSTFQMEDDLSLIVSNALFADGAAASVLWNRPQGLTLVASASRLAPEHREDIRYVHKNGQLYNHLSLRLPQVAGTTVAQVIRDLLTPHGLKPADIKHWALHPGGENVINCVRDEIGLSERQLRKTRDILAAYGNMSSATVWFVLREILDSDLAPGEWCVLCAFGAGLAAHAYLLQA